MIYKKYLYNVPVQCLKDLQQLDFSKAFNRYILIANVIHDTTINCLYSTIFLFSCYFQKEKTVQECKKDKIVIIVIFYCFLNLLVHR